MESFSMARKRIAEHMARNQKETRSSSSNLSSEPAPIVVNEQQLNSLIMRYSVPSAVVLVLPPPPPHHPAYYYMEYMDLLTESIPRLLIGTRVQTRRCHHFYLKKRRLNISAYN